MSRTLREILSRVPPRYRVEDELPIDANAVLPCDPAWFFSVLSSETRYRFWVGWAIGREFRPDEVGIEARAYLYAGHSRSGIPTYGANLARLDLREVFWDNAELREADLSKTNLRGSSFRAADFRAAKLCGANLMSCDLTNASLSRADLRGANLRGAMLRDADLRDADLRGAKLPSRLNGAFLDGAKRFAEDPPLKGWDWTPDGLLGNS